MRIEKTHVLDKLLSDMICSAGGYGFIVNELTMCVT